MQIYPLFHMTKQRVPKRKGEQGNVPSFILGTYMITNKRLAITLGIDNIYVQAVLKFVFQLAPLTNMTQIYVIGRSFRILRTPQSQ